MYADELGEFLRSRIPLSAAMGAEVRSASPDEVVLFAPIAPNLNHRDTVFGGSASAAAILAAWSVLYVRLRAEAVSGRIVIRRNSMSYDRPITEGFDAIAGAPDPADWARLRTTLQRGRTARIRIRARLECRGERAGEFDGEFAVLPPGDAPSDGP
jgi:thioesterase domain-containing protein